MKITKVIQYVVIALIVNILLFGCLLLVHVIPYELLENNIVESSEILYSEGMYKYPVLINPVCIKLDNWTTANTYGNMWLETSYSIKDIIEVKAPSYPDLDIPTEIMYYSTINNYHEGYSYGRYWLGSEIFIRPLSVFFNVNGIRIIFAIGEIVLLACIFIVNKDKKISTIFVVEWIMSGLIINTLCTTYGQESYIILVSVLILSVLNNRVRIQDCEELVFLLIGTFTMFFTYLSYPLMTLCLPMIFYFQLLNSSNDGYVGNLIRLFKLSSVWLFGYLLSMELKGFLCDFFGIKNTGTSRLFELIGNMNIVDRVKVALMRFAGVNGYFNKNEIIVTALLIILLVLIIISTNTKKIYTNQGVDTCILIIGLYPMLWNIIFAEHAKIHGGESMLYLVFQYALITLIYRTVIQLRRKG